MCIYIYVYIYTHSVYIYRESIYIYIVYIYLYMHEKMYVDMYIHTCIYMYILKCIWLENTMLSPKPQGVVLPSIMRTITRIIVTDVLYIYIYLYASIEKIWTITYNKNTYIISSQYTRMTYLTSGFVSSHWGRYPEESHWNRENDDRSWQIWDSRISRRPMIWLWDHY